MATRLSLCQRLGKEAGISGCENMTLPASTLSQSGEMLSLVTWIDDAYQQIQNEHDTWLFLRNNFDFETVADTAEYTPTDAGLPEHNNWKNETLDDRFRYYLTSAGATTEQRMTFVPWEQFRNVYGFGAARTQTGPPQFYTIKPDKSLKFFPIPDDIYTIVGEYFKRPQQMTTNADATTGTPIFPRQYHDAIMWLALMLYGGFESASATYAHAQKQYNKLMGGLYRDQLPAMEMAGSLI